MLRLCFSLLLSLSPLLALNGLTNLSSEEMLGVLGEVIHSASGEDGFDAPLSLYNNEEDTKGYAYSGVGSKNGSQWKKEENKKEGSQGDKKEGNQGDKRDKGKHQRDSKQEWIGFNTRTNDLTNPDEVMNTLFHETSHKGLHHKSKNDAYATNRGNSAESIFALKNYRSKNTNTISTLEWNTRESIREGIKGGGVLTKGNEYNRRAWIGELGGSGERDNARIKRRPLSGVWGMFEKVKDAAHHEQIFFEDKIGGNIGFFGDSQVRPDDPKELRNYNQNVYDMHFDDAIMRRAADNVKWDMGEYHLLKNNCQTFIQRVLHEYGKEYQKMLEKQK